MAMPYRLPVSRALAKQQPIKTDVSPPSLLGIPTSERGVLVTTESLDLTLIQTIVAKTTLPSAR
jgi:hypothetical protein